jgi:predicted transcriptional regulator
MSSMYTQRINELERWLALQGMTQTQVAKTLGVTLAANDLRIGTRQPSARPSVRRAVECTG